MTKPKVMKSKTAAKPKQPMTKSKVMKSKTAAKLKQPVATSYAKC